MFSDCIRISFEPNTLWWLLFQIELKTNRKKPAPSRLLLTRVYSFQRSKIADPRSDNIVFCIQISINAVLKSNIIFPEHPEGQRGTGENHKYRSLSFGI